MTDKIKENAIKIIKLLGLGLTLPQNIILTSNESYNLLLNPIKEQKENSFIELYSSYNGLMPIVFECNKSEIDINIFLYPKYLCIVNGNHKPINYKYNTESEFILALQECIIKYLEVKNGI